LRRQIVLCRRASLPKRNTNANKTAHPTAGNVLL
jgi:hypothetical protein